MNYSVTGYASQYKPNPGDDTKLQFVKPHTACQEHQHCWNLLPQSETYSETLTNGPFYTVEAEEGYAKERLFEPIDTIGSPLNLTDNLQKTTDFS